MHSNEADLRMVIRLLIETIKATPGGTAELGRQVLMHPEIFKVLENLYD